MPKIPKYIESETPLVAAKHGRKSDRQHRRGGAALHYDEGGEQHGDHRPARRGQRAELKPAECRARRRRRRRAARCRRAPMPAHRAARTGPWLSRKRAARAGADEAERDVDPEDPLPAQAGDTAPPTSGPRAMPMPLTPDQMPSASAALRGRRGVASEREGERGDDRGADALEGAGARSARRWRREGGGRGGGGEDPSPITKTRRRPKRSPSAAPGSRKTANASV